MSYVDSLAMNVAESKLPQHLQEAEREQCKRRIGYDFKVTGFNASVVLAIVAVVLAIFTGNLLVCGFSLMGWCFFHLARKAFLESIERTGEDQPSYRGLEERSDEIARHLGIVDPNWKPVRAQIVDYILFLRWTERA